MGIERERERELSENYREIVVTNTFKKLHGRVVRMRREEERVKHEANVRNGFRKEGHG